MTSPGLPLPPARPRRIAFAGTPDDAVLALQALAEAEFEIPVVVTGAPRRRSRRGSDTPSPVAAAAQELDLPVSHNPADLSSCGADCAVVVAYGQLIGEELLAATPMLNLHFSLLPRWRGAAPVERALLAGDDHTGVSLMALEATLDTGPVYWRHEVPIGPADTAAELRNRLAQEGAQHLAGSLTTGLGTPRPQSGEPTYARKLTPADRQIDWSQPAALIDRQIRVGGAWTHARRRAFHHPRGDPAVGRGRDFARDPGRRCGRDGRRPDPPAQRPAVRPSGARCSGLAARCPPAVRHPLRLTTGPTGCPANQSSRQPVASPVSLVAWSDAHRADLGHTHS